MMSRTTCLAGLGGWALLTALVAARPAAPAVPGGHPARPAAKPAPARVRLSAAAAAGFWRRYNCAALWELAPGDGAQSGFFGRSGFRIDFALLHVERDAANPHIYRVQGKSRCLKGIAVPFEGVIVLKQVYQAPAETGAPTRYTVVGSFELTEKRIARNTGTYRGTVATDVALADRGLEIARIAGSPADYCGYKFEGQWRSTGGDVERVVWAENWRTLARRIFADFEMGDRMPSINPKYAERGWNRLWENDEWWADSPA